MSDEHPEDDPDPTVPVPCRHRPRRPAAAPPPGVAAAAAGCRAAATGSTPPPRSCRPATGLAARVLPVSRWARRPATGCGATATGYGAATGVLAPPPAGYARPRPGRASCRRQPYAAGADGRRPTAWPSPRWSWASSACWASFCFGFPGLLFGIIAVVLGILGLRKANTIPGHAAEGRSPSRAS